MQFFPENPYNLFGTALTHYSTKITAVATALCTIYILDQDTSIKECIFQFYEKKAGIYYHFIGNRKNMEVTQFKG